MMTAVLLSRFVPSAQACEDQPDLIPTVAGQGGVGEDPDRCAGSNPVRGL
jgi:hypothetical protein